jgi:methionine synthase I (cobalamin-dependent)
VTRIDQLRDLLGERIVVLDGAWGTMFQTAALTPEDSAPTGSTSTTGTSPATRTCST